MYFHSGQTDLGQSSLELTVVETVMIRRSSLFYSKLKYELLLC